jgi:imidazolonepropionase
MSSAYIITNVRIATLCQGKASYGLIEHGAIVVGGRDILWVGSGDDLPDEYADLKQIDFDGRLVTPALIDCHSHIVHGGNRAREFEMRLQGVSYAQIAQTGGGIVSTVAATRTESDATLLASALGRIDALIAQGVTTVEIKSGYGLNVEAELKMLRVARMIGTVRPVDIVTTYLGAHAVPDGMDADAYIDTICIPALKAAHAEGLVDAVDGFCETIAFTPAQIGRVFDVAKELGLPVKLHAEQLSHMGGAALAARYSALSADHLEYATGQDAALMAKAGTVAVLLPGAFYTLNETRKPPVDAFRTHGVPMALATDWNPGSSPLGSVLLAMNMGCTLFGLTPEEAMAGVTRNAAQALGLSDRGKVQTGLCADLAIWDAVHPAELAYGIAINPLHTRIRGGDIMETQL